MGASIRKQAIAAPTRAAAPFGAEAPSGAETPAGASKASVHRGAWTSERVEQLKGCVDAGLSCSQIAAEIGVTRNAVIGKMNRLGLSRPRSARTNSPAAKRAAGRNGGGNITRLFSQHRILMQLPPEPQGWSAVVSIHAGRGCSLLDLSPGNCRWPVSQDIHFPPRGTKSAFSIRMSFQSVRPCPSFCQICRAP